MSDEDPKAGDATASSKDAELEFLHAEVEILRVRSAALGKSRDEVATTAEQLSEQLAAANARLAALRGSRRWRMSGAIADAFARPRLLFRLPRVLFRILRERSADVPKDGTPKPRVTQQWSSPPPDALRLPDLKV